MRLHGRGERGPSAWAHPFEEEGAIGFAGFDYGVNGSRHLCCDGSVSLAAQIRVVTILRDIAFELVAKAVGGFEHGGLTGQLQRAAQPGIAILGYLASAAEHA